MRMALTARPASLPVSVPLWGNDDSGVTGNIAGAVVVVACRGPAAVADEDPLVSRQNSRMAMPATNTVRARRRWFRAGTSGMSAPRPLHGQFRAKGPSRTGSSRRTIAHPLAQHVLHDL